MKAGLVVKNAVVASLAVSACTFSHTSAATEVITLSEKDSRYRRLAEIQEAICGSESTHLCDVDSDMCISNFTRSLEQKPSGKTVNEKEKADLIEEICKVRATPFEITGLHWLFKKRLDLLQRNVASLGITLPNVVVGALPAREVGAEMAAKTSDSDAVVLVNVRFLQFATMMSDLAFRTVPHKVEAVDRQSFDLSEKAGEELILAHPELGERLFAILDLMRKDNVPVFYLPSSTLVGAEISDYMSPYYSEMIQAFAIAHEIGHVYYGHGASSLNFAELAASVEKFFQWGDPPVNRAIAELEADGFAIKLLRQVGETPSESDEVNSPYGCALSAVQFYFIARGILGEAAIGANQSEPDGPPEVGNDEDVASIANCIVSDKCRVRDLANLSHDLVTGGQHPSDSFRRRVVERAIADHPPQPFPQWAGVCQVASRNLELLWELSRDEYYGRKSWFE